MAKNTGTTNPFTELGPQGTKPAGGKPTRLSPAPGGGITKKVSAGPMGMGSTKGK